MRRGTLFIPGEEPKQSSVARNDAFNQQVLSRLNHRIKKQKRANKELNTTCSKVAKKVYKYTKPLKWLAVLELLLIPYFTKP